MTTRPLYMIPAIGVRHSRFAEVLLASMAAWAWSAPTMVLSDQSRNGWVKVAATHPLGKDIKTGFGRFIPSDHSGPVVLLDADMVAVGPEPEIDFGKPLAHRLSCGLGMDTFFVAFPSGGFAREFSAAWRKNWEDVTRRMNSDVPAFNLTTGAKDFLPLESVDRSRPHPSLFHYFRV
jgi:hypothetical protein